MASLGLGWIGEPAIAHLLRPLLQAAGVVSEIWIHGIAFAVAFTSITAAHLVFGEQAPKIYALRRPETILLWFALPLKLFYFVSYPFMIALNATTSFLLKKIGVKGASEHDSVHSEDEIEPSPRQAAENALAIAVQAIAKGMYNQHRSIILAAPETFGIKDEKAGQWRYLRIKFKLWPGQMKIIEETFEERWSKYSRNPIRIMLPG